MLDAKLSMSQCPLIANNQSHMMLYKEGCGQQVKGHGNFLDTSDDPPGKLVSSFGIHSLRWIQLQDATKGHQDSQGVLTEHDLGWEVEGPLLISCGEQGSKQ